MKNKVVIGIAMLLLVMVAFSGCIDEETPKSTGIASFPQKQHFNQACMTSRSCPIYQ